MWEFRSKFLSLVFILGIIFPSFAEVIDYTQPPLNFTTQDGTVSTYPYRFVVPNGSLTDTATGTILGFTTTGVSGFLKLDQSTPQTVINGVPIFNVGISDNGYLDMLGIANPAAPVAGTARFHATTANGFTRFEQDNEAATNEVLGRDTVFIAKNTTASPIPAMTPVYRSGSTGNVPNIAPAKADSLTTLPAIGVALDAIGANNFGQVMALGIISNVNTSALGTSQIYVSPITAGTLTSTRPTNPNYVQRMGSVLVNGVGNGSLLITTAPFIGNMETGTVNNWTSAGTVTGTQLISNIATGTAPLSVASTTQVANLYATRAASADTETIADDTTTNATMYPTWVTANTGNLPLKVTSTKLVFNPSSGNVGIGNTSPVYRLTLANADKFGSSVLHLSQNYISGVNAGNYGIEIYANDNGVNGDDLRIRGRISSTGSYSDLFSVTNDGKVGCGTTSPATTLDVRGDATFQRTGGTALNIQTPATDSRIFNTQNVPLYIGTNNNAALLTILGNGTIGIGTISPASLLHLHSATTTTDVRMYLTDATTTATANHGVSLIKDATEAGYLWNYENAALHFGTNNLERLTIAAGGAVSTTGDLLAGGGNSYGRLSVTQGASTRVSIALTDGNTNSMFFTAGNSISPTISSDGGLLFRTGITFPSPDTGVSAFFIDAAGAALAHNLIRVQSDVSASAPIGSAGVGIETYVASGTAYQQVYNRTSLAYAPMGLIGSSFTFTQGKIGVNAVPSASWGDLQIYDPSTAAYEYITLRNSLADGTQKSITWRDNTNITAQIDSRYNTTTNTTDLVFGHLYTAGYTTTDLMVIKGNGNFGFGITNPANQFVLAHAYLLAWKDAAGTGETVAIGTNASDTMDFYVSGTLHATLDASGYLNTVAGFKVAGTSPVADGTYHSVTTKGGIVTAGVAGIIPRTAASDPQDATPGNRPAGTLYEIVAYSGKLYFCTNAATPTWEKFTSS